MTDLDFVKQLIIQLPNLAGMVVSTSVCIWIIVQQQKQIADLQNKLDELCSENRQEGPGKK